jgi:hypothetical protein
VEAIKIEAVGVVVADVMNQDQWHVLNVVRKAIWQENVQILANELKETLDIAVEEEDMIEEAIEVIVVAEAVTKKETTMINQISSKVIGDPDILGKIEAMIEAVIEVVEAVEVVSKIEILMAQININKEIEDKITCKEIPKKMRI